MNQSYEAAQCPVCLNWIRFDRHTMTFEQHNNSDGIACPNSLAQLPDDPKIETMDQFALPSQSETLQP